MNPQVLEVCRIVFHLKEGEVPTREQYRLAKVYLFAIQYGAHPMVLASNVPIDYPYQDMMRLFDEIRRANPPPE